MPTCLPLEHHRGGLGPVRVTTEDVRPARRCGASTVALGRLELGTPLTPVTAR
jgi:hypothetical protein